MNLLGKITSHLKSRQSYSCPGIDIHVCGSCMWEHNLSIRQTGKQNKVTFTRSQARKLATGIEFTMLGSQKDVSSPVYQQRVLLNYQK
jgi:hypothetical protein